MSKLKTGHKIANISKTGSVIKKKKTESICKCIYNNKDKIKTLSEEVIFEIKDIEQIISRGHQLSACPYYASRESIKYSQVI